MVFGEIIIVALQSIRANLFRAALTMLGIIIGVGAVITMLAAGAGAAAPAAGEAGFAPGEA